MQKLYALFLSLSLLTTISGYARTVTDNPLESYLWKNRVLLLASTEAAGASMAAQLKQARAEIQERDIVWFVLAGEARLFTNAQETNPPEFVDSVHRRYFAESNTERSVLLIGKDGGVKETAETLELDRIFARVDAMPMRQAELREREAEPVQSKRLFDFTGADPSAAWRATNDGVMGGLSQGGATLAEGSMLFTGVLSLENNGGFSVIYGRGPFDLSRYDGLRFRVLGDGRTYELRINSDAMFRSGDPVSFRQTFDTIAGEWIEVFVPFADLKQSWRGRQLSGYRLNTSDIRRIGFMLADKQAGDFALRVRWLEAGNTSE